MTLVAVSGIAATRARVQSSARGRWWLDAELDGDHTLAGSVACTFSDLSLQGAIVSGGPYQGRSCYRIVAGAGGWSRQLPSKAYNNDGGVKLSTVLGDAARECGETLGSFSDQRIGPHFVRKAGDAAWVLRELVPAWYVDERGVTQIGARASTTYTGDATRQQVDLAAGRIALAPNNNQIATLLPGAVVDGLEVVDVEHLYRDGVIRSIVWGKRNDTNEGRRLAAWRELVHAMVPDLAYRGCYEYRVVTQEGERLNLQIVRSSTGMNDLRRVRVRPGVAGCRADVALGSHVLVTFVDADPTRPVVVGFDDPESVGFAPSQLDLVGEDDPADAETLATATGRVVRYGDPIVFGAAASTGPILPGAIPVELSRVRA